MIARVTKRTKLGPLRELRTARHVRVERGNRLSPTRNCARIAAVEALHAALRSSSDASMKPENWFQLRVVGVTANSRDSDFGRSPLVRCGKYAVGCTLTSFQLMRGGPPRVPFEGVWVGRRQRAQLFR